MTYFDEQKDIPEDIERFEDDRDKGKQPYGHDGDHECDCEGVDFDDEMDGHVDDDGREYDASGHAADCPANPANSDKNQGEGDGDGDGQGGDPEPFEAFDVFDARRFAWFTLVHGDEWAKLPKANCARHPKLTKGEIHSACGILVAVKGIESGKVSIIQVHCEDVNTVPGWKPEWVLKPHDEVTATVTDVDGAFKHVGDTFKIVNVLDCKPLIDWLKKVTDEKVLTVELPKFVNYASGWRVKNGSLWETASQHGDNFIVCSADDLFVSYREEGALNGAKPGLALVNRSWFKKNYPEWVVA